MLATFSSCSSVSNCGCATARGTSGSASIADSSKNLCSAVSPPCTTAVEQPAGDVGGQPDRRRDAIDHRAALELRSAQWRMP